MGSRLEVRLFGRLEVTVDGEPLDLRSLRTRKTCDLLRMLALADGRGVASDRLIDTLWPEATTERARGSLRTAASQIRRAVGFDCIARTATGLLLTDAWVDVTAFEHAAAKVRRHATLEPVDSLTAVLEATPLYRDGLIADEPYAEWAEDDRRRLADLHLELLLTGADLATGQQRWDDAVHLAHTAIAEEPTTERAYRALMRSHAARGELDRALKAFETCRHALSEELGTDPSRETARLHLQLLDSAVATPATPAIADVPEDRTSIEDDLPGLRASLPPEQRAILDLVSILTGSFRTGEVTAALPDVALDVVESTLDLLHDRGVLAGRSDEHRHASGAISEALAELVTSAERRRLHLLAATTGKVTDRVGHLIEAGRPDEAYALALSQGRAALRLGDPEQALELARSYGGSCADADGMLCDVAATALVRLGRYEEAEQLLAHLPAATVRDDETLLRRHGLVAWARGDRAAARVWLERAARHGGGTLRTRLDLLALRAPSDPRGVEPDLQGVVRDAAAAGDTACEALARAVLSADVLAAQRRFTSAAQEAQTARRLAEETEDPRVLARTLLLVAAPLVTLGRSTEALLHLRRAHQLSLIAADAPLTRDVTAALVRALDDLGSPEADVHCEQLSVADVGHPTVAGVLITWLRRRGRHEEAILLARRPAFEVEATPETILATAALLVDQGRSAEAEHVLADLLDGLRRSGARVLLPTVASQLALVLAEARPDTADGLLAAAEDACAGQQLGRERASILLARATVIAHRDGPEEALGLARLAVDAAADAGLASEEMAGLELRADLEERLGRPTRAHRSRRRAQHLAAHCGRPASVGGGDLRPSLAPVR